MVIGAFLASIHYELTINHKKRTYRRSIFIFGFRAGINVPFQAIINCRIIKGRVTDLYMVGPFGIPSSKDRFHAFLEFDNGDFVEMGASKNRADLVRKVNKFRHRYEFPILDSEDETHQFDDLTTKLARVPVKNSGKDTLTLGFVSLTLCTAMLITELLEYGGFGIGTLLWVLISLFAVCIGTSKVLKYKKLQTKKR